MSEMVRETGKLVPFEFSSDNLTIYEMVKELISAGVDVDEYDSVSYDCITGDGVVVIHGVVYIIKDFTRSNPGDGYSKVIPNDDGTFNFDTVYHNGSTFLEEELEEAFDNIDAITLICNVHDKSNVRIWDIDLTHISEENMNAHDIVFEYMKLNTTLPVDIIKELGKDEVYRIIKDLNWHI